MVHPSVGEGPLLPHSMKSNLQQNAAYETTGGYSAPTRAVTFAEPQGGTYSPSYPSSQPSRGLLLMGGLIEEALSTIQASLARQEQDIRQWQTSNSEKLSFLVRHFSAPDALGSTGGAPDEPSPRPVHFSVPPAPLAVEKSQASMEESEAETEVEEVVWGKAEAELMDSEDTEGVGRVKTSRRVRFGMDEDLPQIPRLYQVPQRCRDLLYSSVFEWIVAFFICLNTIALAMEIDYKANGGYGFLTPDFFTFIGWGFCAVFLFEILFRLVVDQEFAFLGPNRWWNLFDTVSVAVSIVELLGMNGGSSGFKVLKICRVFKFLRVFRFFADLRKMVVGIIATLSSLFWALIVLAMILFVFALVMTDLVTNLRTEGIAAESTIQDFGSLSATFYTLLKAVSGGGDWGDFSDPLVELDPLFLLLFAIYIALIVYCVLNVVTAVFVEKMSSHEESRKHAKMYQELLKFVKDADADSNGQLNLLEFTALCKKPVVRAWLRKIDLDLDSIGVTNFFKALHPGGTGNMDKEEFIRGVFALKGYARSYELHLMQQEVHEIRTSSLAVKDALEKLSRRLLTSAAEKPPRRKRSSDVAKEPPARALVPGDRSSGGSDTERFRPERTMQAQKFLTPPGSVSDCFADDAPPCRPATATGASHGTGAAPPRRWEPPPPSLGAPPRLYGEKDAAAVSADLRTQHKVTLMQPPASAMGRCGGFTLNGERRF
eukprot:TRINITY_DN1308_c0_g5_i1.p1 TRINITY_DN1308_c0_g5~~TRINITY_DN1308_c0_g5_i1.p1  ORF type:complete len:730 (+),score=141.01 TRINITY_DN1308_c0_g5_i1:49-2190(+)